jgi:hypothetical protein
VARVTVPEEHLTPVWQTTRRKKAKTNLSWKRTEKVTNDKWLAMTGDQSIQNNLLVLLQVNCISVLNKSLVFWNLIDIHNPNVITGKQSWLRDDISNTKVFRDNNNAQERWILEFVECSSV